MNQKFHVALFQVCPLESKLVCALPRGQCRGCGKVLTVRAPWEGRSGENAVWVRADERNRRKGHDYLTRFVDLAAQRVLLAVKGTRRRERFAEPLVAHNGQPKAIPQVAIDMSPADIKV